MTLDILTCAPTRRALILAGILVSAAAGAETGTDKTPAAAAPLEDIVVYSRRDRDPSEISVGAKQLVEVPGALGDALSAVFSLPGVVYAGGDTGTPAVRGSGPGDNLYMVDSLPVAYVFHNLDIGASVYSDQILGTFDLLPGAFGPEYTNVTGAVFDIGLRDPRNQPLSATVDVSMLRSGVFLESAITQNSAAYLSYRQSMIHLFIKSGDEKDGVVLQKVPRDDDYQFKYVWHLTEHQKLTASANGAGDSAAADFQSNSQVAAENPDYTGDAQLSTRYNNQSVLWDYGVPNAAQVRVALGHSRQDNKISYGRGYYYDETLDRHIARALYDQPLSASNTVHLTGELNRNRHEADFDQVLFVCNEFDPTCGNVRRGIVTGSPSLMETSRSIGISDTWHFLEQFRLDVGGQYHANDYTREHFAEPRGALTWTIDGGTSVALKAGRYDRFPDLQNLLPGFGNPRLKSSQANHFAFNVTENFGNGWSLSVEPYYKKIFDLPLALNPLQPDAAQLYSNDVSGRVYGMDVLLEKKRIDKWYGWLALSLARSQRANERTGITDRYYLDTPLVMTAIWNYQLRPRLNLGARLTVRSGQPNTPIIGVQQNPDFPEAVAPVYGAPYSDRLPLYRRLDLRAKWDFTVRGYPSSLSLDIINALNSRNVDGYQLDFLRSKVGGPPYLKTGEGMSMFPALTFRIAF